LWTSRSWWVTTRGREWIITIHTTAVKRCRALVDVDLYGLVDEGFKGLGKLFSDPVKFVDTIYVLCKDEADARGISDEDFGRAMAGDAIGNANAAFCEELADFFPDPRIRAGLRKVIDATRKVTDSLMKDMERQIENIDTEVVAKKLIALSGNSRESSASTPDPLRFVN